MNTESSSKAVSEVPSRDQLFQSCEHIARRPDILDCFIAELNRCGFAGEEQASRLIYLGLTTRLFKDPVSIAVKGPSSAGKSHTVKEVLKFFPPENYYEMSAMSEKALAYMDQELRHRFLVVYEAEGMSGKTASYFIRSLLSEGCINYKTLSKDSDGKWHATPLYVEGPTGLLTTTTLVSLHPENETRLLSMSVNDSPDQTRRIMDAMVSEVENLELDYAPWHAFQNWIAQSSTRVIIPFGRDLAASAYAGSVRIRRDFPKLLSLIRAHALLHQQSRDRHEGGALIATISAFR